jgi:hypothetical protein
MKRSGEFNLPPGKVWQGCFQAFPIVKALPAGTSLANRIRRALFASRSEPCAAAAES